MFFSNYKQLAPINELIRLYNQGRLSPDSSVWQLKYRHEFNQEAAENGQACSGLLQHYYKELKVNGQRAIREGNNSLALRIAEEASELFGTPGFLLAWMIYYDLAKTVEDRADYQLHAFLALYQAESFLQASAAMINRLAYPYDAGKVVQARELTFKLGSLTEEQIDEFIQRHLQVSQASSAAHTY